MTFPSTISTTAIEYVIGCLLPLLMAGLGGDEPAARALAVELLASHNPQTPHELRLAGNAVGLSLQGLAKLADSAAPGITSEKQDVALKWACSLSRAGQATERRLEEIQRVRRAEARSELPKPPAVAEVAPATPIPCPPIPCPPPPAATVFQPPAPGSSAATTDTAPALPNAAYAEAKLQSAEKLLGLMQAHHKGAPPPHSKAAQDIQQQKRVVEMARMNLAQARKREQQAAQRLEPAPSPG